MRLPPPPSPLAARTGWLAWIVFFTVIAVLLAARPVGRRVNLNYRQAVETWWDGEVSMYGEGISGFLYLPSFALVYTPFTWGPPLLSDYLWRGLSLLLFATGLARFVRLARGPPDLFALATWLALAGTWAAAHTGQANVPLAGLFLHATVDLVKERWWRASFALALALVVKPIAMPILLLAAVLQPRTSWRIAVALALLVGASFLHPDPSYVLGQHQDFVRKATTASQPGDTWWNDVVGLLRTLGWNPPQAVRTGLALAAAVATFGLSWAAFRRGGRVQGCLMTLAFGCTYLMLFNPRTETNTYVILVPVTAAFAAACLLHERRRAEGVALALLSLGLGCDVYGTPFFRATNYWLKPLLALVFLGYLAWRLAALPRRPVLAAPEGLNAKGPFARPPPPAPASTAGS